MELPLVTVDAFSDKPFSGNPAGICLLPGSLSPEWMQRIAAEVNLSETAFLETIDEQNYHIRWFTPEKEVDLCGHATLASAFLLYTAELADKGREIVFSSKSGTLKASWQEGEYAIALDFPLIPTQEAVHPYFSDMFFGQQVIGSAKLARNWLLELANPKAVEYVMPVWSELTHHSEEGLIVTAASAGAYDMVSRYFAPNLGIPEDPVTGFAHCALVDYWHRKTGREHFTAFQASSRGGVLGLSKKDDRVLLKGNAVKMFEGFFTLEP